MFESTVRPTPKHLDRVKALRRAMEGVSQPALLHQLQAGRCFYCDKPLNSASHAPNRPDGWTIDHVIPQTFGGARFFGNKVLSCAACNGAKGNRLPTDLELAAVRQLWAAVLIINPGAAPLRARPASATH